MNMFLARMTTLMAALPDTGAEWLNKLIKAVVNVINPMLILVAVAGVIYSIVVGVKFVKADSKDEREEAKQKLITVIIGVVVTFVLIALFYFLAFNIGEGKLFDVSKFFFKFFVAHIVEFGTRYSFFVAF